MPPTLIDNRYALTEHLGTGGMGTVYLARDIVLNRDVALKFLRDQYAESDEFVERFRDEAKSAAALNHPNIVSVYDLGRSAGDGTYYMVMEFVPGGTLRDRIVGEPLDPNAVAELGLRVAGALGTAHEHGMIHRDVKSQNILLCTSGEPKVADFGISRAPAATALSRANLVLGTPNYISPEQAIGEPVGPVSDLYSLGVVLYEILTGKVPFQAETPVAIAIKHLREPPRPPKEVNPKVPEGMNALILRLLAKNPRDRYGNAAELGRDLREVVRDGLLPTVASTYVGVPAWAAKSNEAKNHAATPVPPRVPELQGSQRKRTFAPYGSVRGHRRFRRLRSLAAVATLLVLFGALVWDLPQEDHSQGNDAYGSSPFSTAFEPAATSDATTEPVSAAPETSEGGDASSGTGDLPSGGGPPVPAGRAEPATEAPRAPVTGVPSAGDVSQKVQAAGEAAPVAAPATDVPQGPAAKTATSPATTSASPPTYDSVRGGEETQKKVSKAQKNVNPPPSTVVASSGAGGR